MIDLTPNDLSHLSDEEFNALCPQGEHAPGPEPLSPTIEQLLQMPGSSWVKYSPWEREGYCDEQGRCWFQQYGKWILAHPESIANSVCCLPAYVNPKVTQ